MATVRMKHDMAECEELVVTGDSIYMSNTAWQTVRN